jgi:CO/xanthine dehydrogenase Mo-binding subunit
MSEVPPISTEICALQRKSSSAINRHNQELFDLLVGAQHYRQPIALVVAKTSEIARFAASLVRVEYNKEAHVTDVYRRPDAAIFIKPPTTPVEALFTPPKPRRAICSNDPIYADHQPDSHSGDRATHGAACHSCLLIAETSCEMRNLLSRPAAC